MTDLAEPARRNSRLPRERLRSIIMELCRHNWLTAGDLGHLLIRTPEKLQERVLTGMVREGLLEWRHPEVPNRPDQAYRTKR